MNLGRWRRCLNSGEPFNNFVFVLRSGGDEPRISGLEVFRLDALDGDASGQDQDRGLHLPWAAGLQRGEPFARLDPTIKEWNPSPGCRKP
jgi:hypothetical protein